MTWAQNLGLFWILILGIVAVPGMDMLLVLGNSLARGWRTGMATVAGIMLAGAVHTGWGTLGAGVLAQMPHSVAQAMLAGGAAYLGWIGVTLIRSRITLGEVPDGGARHYRTALRQGALTAILNPKAWVFVLSVFPQFIRPAFGPLALQALVIALLVAATQLAVYGAVALAAGKVRRGLKRNPQALIWTGRATGGIMLAASALMLAEALH